MNLTSTIHWVDASERLPKICGKYLISTKDKNDYGSIIQIARYNDESQNKWKASQAYSFFENVTHWAELPQPPESEEK